MSRSDFLSAIILESVLPAFFTFSVGLSMAGNSPQPCCIGCMLISLVEICSAHPTSGGPYYWSAMLAKPKSAPFASWITGLPFFVSNPYTFTRSVKIRTGWFNLLGQVAVTTGIRLVLVNILFIYRPISGLCTALLAPLSCRRSVLLAQILCQLRRLRSGFMPQFLSAKV